MTIPRAALPFFAVSFLAAAEAHAQAFNIDLGARVSKPSAAYGAAAGQAGTWNIGHFGDVASLVALDGSPTPATLIGSSSGGSTVVVPSGSADEQEMMGDYDRFRINDGGYIFQHIQPGTYDIYVYSWRGTLDGGAPGITISAPGGPYGLSIASGQPWPGQQVLGVTYGVVRITLGAVGTFGISGSAGAEGTAPINGIQIVPVPTPGPCGLLALGSSLAIARRRR